MSTKLSPSERNSIAQKLPDWSLSENTDAISKRYSFKTFPEAFAFMTHIALHAEAMDHHPDWSNCYNKVDIKLTTHDAGGLTQKDMTLAQICDDAAEQYAR
jgi:4a-hydroxytetrahydrobiopterin dehydratase